MMIEWILAVVRELWLPRKKLNQVTLFILFIHLNAKNTFKKGHYSHHFLRLFEDMDGLLSF